MGHSAVRAGAVMIDKAMLLARLEELRQTDRTGDFDCDEIWRSAIADLMDEVEGWTSPHRKLEATSIDVEAIRERHSPKRGDPCRYCYQDQPCDANVLLARLVPAEDEIVLPRYVVEGLLAVGSGSKWYPAAETARAALGQELVLAEDEARAVVVPDLGDVHVHETPPPYGVPAEDEGRLREDGDGYQVQTWVPHHPSGVVVLKGHPQLSGRYCLTDGGDWPCAAVRAALAATPEQGDTP